MLCSSLDTRLSGIREHTTGNSEEDLSADHTRVARAASTVLDKEAEGDEEEEGARNDEPLQAADLEDDQAKDDTSDDGGEAVELGDACGALDAFIEGDEKDGVEVVSLKVPCAVEHHGNAEGTPDSAVFEKLHSVLVSIRLVNRVLFEWYLRGKEPWGGGRASPTG